MNINKKFNWRVQDWRNTSGCFAKKIYDKKVLKKKTHSGLY